MTEYVWQAETCIQDDSVMSTYEKTGGGIKIDRWKDVGSENQGNKNYYTIVVQHFKPKGILFTLHHAHHPESFDAYVCVFTLFPLEFQWSSDCRVWFFLNVWVQ